MDFPSGPNRAALIETAARCTDLDRACAVIQRYIGQDDGGVAGLVFSGPEGDEYETADLARRKELLANYLLTEEAMQRP
jgi:hypothetical protein